jgi:hypothetical protein
MSARHPKLKWFAVTIKVRSENGKPPIVRSLGGDTIFCTLTEDGQSATWTIKRHHPKPKAPK